MEKKKQLVLLLAAMLLFLNFFVWKEVFVLSQKQNLKVDFLNVGQGDSEFIQTPEGHQILIDGGPDSTVLEKLNKRMPFWDKSLDLVILTHPEKDHMQGLLDILQKYKVDYFLWSGIKKDDAENKQLTVLLDKVSSPQNFLSAISGKFQTRIIAAQAGEKIKAGKVEIDILAPFENLAGKDIKNTSNDTSVVSRVIFGKESFLFTGDIDSVEEKALANSAEFTDLKSDVLKVAHHGSKYSTSDLFLAAVKPSAAVIEVGKNTYGHPTPEVLQRLQKSGIKVLRTDINGDIEMISDGNRIEIP